MIRSGVYACDVLKCIKHSEPSDAMQHCFRQHIYIHSSSNIQTFCLQLYCSPLSDANRKWEKPPNSSRSLWFVCPNLRGVNCVKRTLKTSFHFITQYLCPLPSSPSFVSFSFCRCYCNCPISLLTYFGSFWYR